MDTSEGDKMDSNPPLVVPLIGQGAASLARASNEKAKKAQLISDAFLNNLAFITLCIMKASQEITNIISTSQNYIFFRTNSLLLNLKDLDVQDIELKIKLQIKK
uniref:Uncharacterized protein n=1 Tax=Physcomitrium patens TaxID=3218 RepID=A0A2K1II61_PHYPA|nr:hypothetical protein PHYPA_027656 [Physcomitrium patens]